MGRHQDTLAVMVGLTLGLLGCDGAPTVTPPPDPSAAWRAVSSRIPVITTTADGRTRTVALSIAYTGDVSVAARDVLREHGHLFGIDDADRDLRLIGVVPLGGVGAEIGEVAIFALRHGGVTVFGGDVRVVAAAGELRFISASVPPSSALASLSTEPSITEEDATAALAVQVGLDPPLVPSTPELLIFDPAMIRDAEHDGAGGEPALAWSLEASSDEGTMQVFLSAADGALLASLARTRDARLRLVSNAKRVGDHRLVFATGESVRWLDELGLISGAPVEPEETGVYAEAQRLFETLGRVYDFWYDLIGYDGYDGRGSLIRGFVNFRLSPPELSNAFWSARAASDPLGERSGGLVFDVDMVTDDIVAHEYTHAVLDHYTRTPPVSCGEPGAVEESLGDAFAAFLTTGAGQWTMAEGSRAGSSRDLADPHAPRAWRPACYAERFGLERSGPGCASLDCDAGDVCFDGECLQTDSDSGGVHRNATIGGRAAHLMVQGSAGSAPAGSACGTQPEVRSVDLDKVALVYAVSFALVHRTMTFEDLAQAVINSCVLLAEAGAGPPRGEPLTIEECSSIANAFAAVGIADGDRDYDGVYDSVDLCADVPAPGQADGCPMGAGTDAGPRLDSGMTSDAGGPSCREHLCWESHTGGTFVPPSPPECPPTAGGFPLDPGRDSSVSPDLCYGVHRTCAYTTGAPYASVLITLYWHPIEQPERPPPCEIAACGGSFRIERTPGYRYSYHDPASYLVVIQANALIATDPVFSSLVDSLATDVMAQSRGVALPCE